jgi:predicted nucleic acid-binding protein
MNLTVEIPDDLVGRLNAAGGDLPRRALVALALEDYKSGHITKAEMPRVLGLLLIDNREGVMAARRRGFRVTGILGVLSMAARRDLYRQEIMDQFPDESSSRG